MPESGKLDQSVDAIFNGQGQSLLEKLQSWRGSKSGFATHHDEGDELLSIPWMLEVICSFGGGKLRGDGHEARRAERKK